MECASQQTLRIRCHRSEANSSHIPCVLLNLSTVDRMVLSLNITILDVHETYIFEEIELRE
jgi:hypothetical protein